MELSKQQLYFELDNICQKIEGASRNRVSGDDIMLNGFKQNKAKLIQLLEQAGEIDPLSNVGDQ